MSWPVSAKQGAILQVDLQKEEWSKRVSLRC